MRKYTVDFKNSAFKELDRLPALWAERIFDNIQLLADDPRPPGCKKLKGGDSEWRIRCGDYWFVYTIDDEQTQIRITRIRHRRDVYD